MEPQYRHTRNELNSMIDGEIQLLVSAFTQQWWALHDASKELSSLITNLHQSGQALSRWATEMQDEELPLQDPTEDQDHGNH